MRYDKFLRGWRVHISEGGVGMRELWEGEERQEFFNNDQQREKLTESVPV